MKFPAHFLISTGSQGLGFISAEAFKTRLAFTATTRLGGADDSFGVFMAVQKIYPIDIQ